MYLPAELRGEGETLTKAMLCVPLVLGALLLFIHGRECRARPSCGSPVTLSLVSSSRERAISFVSEP